MSRIDTVINNMTKYTQHQINNTAAGAHKLQDTTGLKTNILLIMIDIHYIINCRITKGNFRNIIIIWAPSIVKS